MLYRRPAKQHESDFSLTNKVHDTKFDTSRVPEFKDVGNLSLLTFCHMKLLSPTLYNFQCVKFNLNEQVFYVLFTNEHSLTYNQNDCLAFFFETYVTAAIQMLRF